MINVALIGIGGMGNVHFNAYKKMSNARVIAVADVRTDMAREKVADESIAIYSTVDELLKSEKPDMIDICTPSYLHKEIAIKALEAGIHVLSEKPMSLNTQDTSEIIAAAEKSGKLFMTAHVVRFMTPYRYLKSVIDSAELGKPVHIDMKRISAIPKWSWEDWMRCPEKSGGATIDLSIHDIDFAQYVFGEPKKVSAVHYMLKNNSDYIVSQLIYDGFAVSITGGWYSCDIKFRAEYTAIFENGYIESKGGKLYKNGEEISLEQGDIAEDTGINISGVDGYADEIACFIDCIEKGRKPECVTPESSESSIRLAERLLSAAVEL